MSYGTVMQFVREQWGREALMLNGSIVKALWKKWPEREVEAMVKGAAALGWQDLRTINSKDGLGRRMAIARYWQSEHHQKPQLESLAAVLKRKGLIS